MRPEGSQTKGLAAQPHRTGRGGPRKFYMCVGWVNNAAAELLSREVVN